MKISLKQISTNEHMYIWAMEQLCAAFPASERRDDDVQRQAMLHPDYRLCAIMNGDVPVGVVGFWETDQFIYFENFCISASFRNNGYGSATLRLLSYYAQNYAPSNLIFNASAMLYCENGKIADVLQESLQQRADNFATIGATGGSTTSLQQNAEETMYCEKSATPRNFILEIEPPVDRLTCRRKAFYLRNGMVENPYPHIQPHYRPTDPDLPLVVLSYAKKITPEQYAQFKQYLDDNVDVK